MLRGRLRVLFLLTAHLLCAELRHTEEASSIGNRGKTEPASCGTDCEDRTKVRKRSPQGAKCELYYFVPTAKHTDEAFFVWDNAKAEQLEAYHKIASFLRTNPHEVKPIFFPAHLPLVEQRDSGINAMVLKDVYVRAQGMCGERYDSGYFDTTPAWFTDPIQRPQEELRILEDYVQRIPRSHWGYRVPEADEHDVCLDDTGLVVKEFPGIRTCFSMWIFDDRDPKPKHFAGRQIYNRINQKTHLRGPTIVFAPSAGDSSSETNRTDSPGGTNRTELFSLPALFLKEMCHVTNESLKNRCTYWASSRFYVSLCCCYTNRRECAYKTYKFLLQKKPGDPEIRACATGHYYLLKGFAGNREPRNGSDIASSVKQFVQEKTSSEFCKWTFTWYSSNETKLEDALRVDLGTEEPGAIRDQPAAFAKWIRACTSTAKSSCCRRTTTLCPLDANSTISEIAAECFCRDDDLCNKRRSALNQMRVEMFKKTRPCETHTVYEHVLSQTAGYKKPNTDRKHGYMCPVFYNFAHRKDAFLQLVFKNNFALLNESDHDLFQEDGCHLVEVEIKEVVGCTDKLFGEQNETSYEKLLILLCSVEGNPLGENRTSYPDAELKKTIAANLTAAKEAFPTCKTDYRSLDFESLSELVVDNHKLARMYDNLTEGTNDNITTAHCYAEVSFVYQHRYDFTFGAVSIDNKLLHDACHERGGSPRRKCVQWNSTANDEHQHFACCCQRHWSRMPDMCREVFLDQLKTLLGESVIAKKPGEIMDELKRDPLSKCDKTDKANAGIAGIGIARPCARNDGCYTGVHARHVQATTHHKKFGGCVSEYAPDAQKRDTTSGEVEARFYRICRLPINKDQCFAVLGTEDAALPDDVKGPQMVCCCRGQLDSAQKCGTSQYFGVKIGDFDL